jgi:hypothetical protein
MSEETKIILEMLSAGKINVDEANKLLDGMSETQSDAALPKSVNKKFLRILVLEENNTKVNINIPIALAEAGMKLIPKDKLKIDGKDINVDEILKLIQEGNEGELVNIESHDKGKEIKVKIYID